MTTGRDEAGDRFRTMPPRVAPEETVAVHGQPGDAARLGWAVAAALGTVAAGDAACGATGGCGDGD